MGLGFGAKEGLEFRVQAKFRVSRLGLGVWGSGVGGFRVQGKI